MHRLSAMGVVGALLTASVASGQISGTYLRGYYPPDPGLGDTERPDLIAVTNEGPQRVLRFGMYLSKGADADGDGFALFFDTVSPNAEAPPASGQTQPGYGGAARLRVDPADAATVGYLDASELYVAFPGTLLGPDGDGAVQLVTIVCDHFDPGETLRLGIDVDGFDDFLGAPLGDDAPPAGVTVAMGQSMIEGLGQVYFDIVAGEAPQPVAVPLRTSWLVLGGLLIAIGVVHQNRIRSRCAVC